MPGKRGARHARGRTEALVVVLTLLGLCSAWPAPAAPPPHGLGFPSPWLSRRWTTEHGLPQNSVTALLQSRDGYLWIGTFGGLARFDGLRFTVFDAGDGLGSSRILALAEDAEGTLWIGTEDAGLWRREGGRFEPWPSAGFEETGAVWSVLAHGDALWLGTSDGVLRVPRSGGGARRLGVAEGLPDRWVRALATDAEGELWVGTGRGTAVLVGDRFVARGVTGSIWALPTGPAGALTAVGEETAVALPEGRPLGAGTEALSGLAPRAAAWDREGGLWLGGRGVGRVEPGVARLEQPLRVEPPLDGLAPPVVRAALEDREGSLWLGTDTGGLVRLRRADVRMLGPPEGLPAESVLPILEDRAGTVWVGGWCGGLFRSTTQGFEPLLRPDGRSLGCISALYEDRAGALWIGGDSLTRYAAGKLTWPAEAADLPPGRISALAEDEAGTLWIGTSTGLAALAGGVLRVFREADGLPHRNVRSLLVARDGALWVGTQRGVARRGPAPPEAGGFETPGAAGAPTEPVRDIFPDEDGALWLATYGGGLVRHHQGRFDRVTTAQRLPENFVSRILADGDYLWLCGNRGIYRIERRALSEAVAGDRQALSALTFRTGEGLRVAECHGGGQPAGWRSRDGRLWFPTVAGVAVIDARSFSPNPLPPPVVVEAVLIDGRPVPLGTTVEVPAGASHVEIDFTALSLVASEAIRFRYRLRGFEAGWQESGRRRTAFYTRVPPGKYHFEVAAADRDGVWNGQGAELELRFQPRLHQTAWFQGGLLGLLVVAPLLLYRVRTSRLRARERALATGIELATAELSTEHRRAEAQLVELAHKEAELASLNRDLATRVDEQTRELSNTRDMAVITLAKLAELRDGATGQHLERIAEFSQRLAKLLARRSGYDLPPEFVDQLFRSSPLHDIGKVAIPDSILRKPGRLTTEERAIIESHTTIGGDTLRSVIERHASHFLVMGMDIAYSHHERWDGTGYPRRLAGEAIPLAARIVGLVDAYDAITSQRPYKPRLSHDEAVRRIAVERGRHFDPELVELFLSIESEFAELSDRLQPPDA